MSEIYNFVTKTEDYSNDVRAYRVKKGDCICIVGNHDVKIGDNCKIENTIIDKDTVIGNNSIIGTGDDYQPNKDNPKVLSSGINVIGKKLILPEGLVIERNVRIFSSTKTKEITQKHITSGETLK